MDNNITQFLAKKAPTKWLVEGLIPLGHLVMVVAKPGAGKSLLIEYLMMCIAGGLDFCGFKTTGGNVIKIDGETSDRDLHTRFTMFRNGLGIKEFAHKFDIQNQKGYYFSNGTLSSATFREYVKDATLIVIDSLLSLSGVFDIAKNKDMAIMMQIMKKWLHPNCTVIFIHHMLKAADDGIILDTGVGFDRLYLGAVAIEAIVDTEFAIVPVHKEGDLLSKVIVRAKPKRTSLEKCFCKPFILKLIEEEEPKYAKFVYDGYYEEEMSAIENEILIALHKREGESFTHEVVNDFQGLHGEAAVRAALRSLEQKGMVYLAKAAHNTFKWGLTNRGKIF